MIITKKYLSRRMILRGVGATMALPLLDSMVPALSALRTTAARRVPRLAVVYVPNGMNMPRWTPSREGTRFGLSPILEPLTPFREKLIVLSGLADKYGWPQGAEGAGDHARAASTFLTGVHIKKTEGADIQSGISMDQIAAQALGRETQLASLEIGLESSEFLGGCDAGYSCAYANTISWRSPSTPLPMENDPRALFERLFGSSDSTDAAARRDRISKERSILDSVTETVADLARGLGQRDRGKLAGYLDAIRDIERRIQRAEEQSTRELPVVDRPAGIPTIWEEHARLMFDLLTIAYQTDMTRIATFMIGHETSSRAYPEIGVPEGHHPVSHHANNPERLNSLAKINGFHVKQLAYFLAKLQATADGDGTLLDHSMVLYGSGLSDSNTHFHDDLPILLAGGGAGHVKGGRLLTCPKDTPVTNLLLSLLDTMGVPMESLGDSTGKIDQLSLG
jgi:hypothetical protein